MIEGTSVHVEDRQTGPPHESRRFLRHTSRAVHAPRGGPNGARAIVSRVHDKNQPERTVVLFRSEGMAHTASSTHLS